MEKAIEARHRLEMPVYRVGIIINFLIIAEFLAD